MRGRVASGGSISITRREERTAHDSPSWLVGFVDRDHTTSKAQNTLSLSLNRTRKKKNST
eukprot:478933-Rhodomonas_salina.2